ncbi:MAG: ABC1 kinase family protein [Mycobacteriaceae bacterium]
MSSEIPTGRIVRGTRFGMALAGQKFSIDKNALRATEQLLDSLSTMKGVAMKLGQMLASLDLGLVPEESRVKFQEKLSTLFHQAPALPFNEMSQVIEEELGAIKDIFSSFEQEPIASASIGQVYRAVLADGRKVAVKVQYPGIDQAIKADIRNLRLFIKFWKSAMPLLVNPGILDELQSSMDQELDYRQEAKTQHRLAKWFYGHPNIFVPEAIMEYCTDRVLVTEFVDGVSFDIAQKLRQEDRDQMGETIYRFYVGSIYVYGEFAADPHPGNVIRISDGRIAFMDFGLYKKISMESVDFERKCFQAAIEGRASDLATLMSNNGFFDMDKSADPHACMRYALDAMGLVAMDEVRQASTTVAGAVFRAAMNLDFSSSVESKSRRLPSAHLLSRRTDIMTFGMLGRLGARANWHRIAREYLYSEAPTTAQGLADQNWRLGKSTTLSL